MIGRQVAQRLLLGVPMCVALGAGPGWAQFGGPPQPGGQNGPLAFGVDPGAGAPPQGPPQYQPQYQQPQYQQPQYQQPQYQPQPQYPPQAPFAGSPQPQYPQPQYQPQPQQPPQAPVAGGPSQEVLQRLAQTEREDYGVPPTRQLHTGAPHAPTPNTLPGGQVITTLGLVSLLQGGNVRPVLLDALGGPQHLPGAIPAAFAAEAGSFNDAIQQRLASLLQQATGGNRQVPVVVYCSDPHCWMSYNAALRVAALGLTNVLWYRGGLAAWQQAGLPLEGGGASMPPQAGPAGFNPSRPAGPQQLPQSGPQSGPQPPTGPAPQGGQGGAYTLGDVARGIKYGRNGVWDEKATPDGSLVMTNREGAGAYTAEMTRQPALPFTFQIEVATGFTPHEGSAVGAGVVFAYNRDQGGTQTFYTLLLAGSTTILYHHTADGFEELSRFDGAAPLDQNGAHFAAAMRVTVRADGFTVSVDSNEVTQSADGPMTGFYGVMASGLGEGAFRNLQVR